MLSFYSIFQDPSYKVLQEVLTMYALFFYLVLQYALLGRKILLVHLTFEIIGMYCYGKLRPETVIKYRIRVEIDN